MRQVHCADDGLLTKKDRWGLQRAQIRVSCNMNESHDHDTLTTDGESSEKYISHRAR